MIKNLKTPDSKEIAIKQCVVLKSELSGSKANSAKQVLVPYSSDFDRREKINNLVEIVFKLNIALCEYDEAIKYFTETMLREIKRYHCLYY